MSGHPETLRNTYKEISGAVLVDIFGGHKMPTEFAVCTTTFNLMEQHACGSGIHIDPSGIF